MGIEMKNVTTSYKVQCKTLNYLLDEYNISGLYLLKIDTEGHDTVILDYFLRI